MITIKKNRAQVVHEIIHGFNSKFFVPIAKFENNQTEYMLIHNFDFVNYIWITKDEAEVIDGYWNSYFDDQVEFTSRNIAHAISVYHLDINLDNEEVEKEVSEILGWDYNTLLLPKEF